MRFIPCAATSLVLWAACAGAASAQVVNGDFETGTLAPFQIDDSACNTVVNAAVVEWGGPSGFGFQGNCNDGSGALIQTVTTVAGAQYTLTANVTDWSGNPSNVVRLSLGDAAPVTCTLTNTYTPCTGTFTAPTSAELLRVSFQTVNGSGMVFIDDIAMTLLALPPNPQARPVPSTSGLALLALATLLGGWGARRAVRARL